ncbi:type II toxin-antitoxin system VapC family toxin [Actinoallomurus rhizosphaericola]|uniref:type II toxin-antitoxin system VapC family toxin n=1 Tax=Actinoallomurus rhizosphaericola TaxID=2952536 RepID=UPI00209045CE|nr:type II toxin-antitoxin system VapC family toxin [Actinoallomurus rhizosphaericola]MCO5994428.1 type II toxin-antitoxin system VapC family toxin [Actinoallomurus rhizosphaericola]
MIVVDTSAILRALADEKPDARLTERLTGAPMHVPHLIDTEILHALRGLVLGRKMTPDRANDARRDFAALPLTRYPVRDLGERVWSLRGNLTASDACYVALAEALDCPLVTSDAKLKKASGHYAEVEVYPPA